MQEIVHSSKNDLEERKVENNKSRFRNRYHGNIDTPVATLLIGMGVNRNYIEPFDAEQMDLETFLNLEDDDLIELGIEQSDIRQNILSEIKKIKKRKVNKTQNMKPDDVVYDVTKIFLSCSNHLVTLSKLLRCVRGRLSVTPVVNQLVDKGVSASRAAADMSELNMKRIEMLHLELQQLLQDLELNEKNKKPLKPLRPLKKKIYAKKCMIGILVVTTVFAAIKMKFFISSR